MSSLAGGLNRGQGCLPKPLLGYDRVVGLVLVVLLFLSLIELGIFTAPLWPIRRFMGAALAALQLIWLGWLLIGYFDGFNIVLAVISLYRIFNLMRLYANKIQAEHLRRSALKSSYVLMLCQLVFLMARSVSMMLNLKASFFLSFILAGQLVISGLFYITAKHWLERIKPGEVKNYRDKDLPSISVCLPARNETEDLKLCLDSLISSDYPKLEIIVLDDCSQSKRTPDIIRSFASSGVRFIAGQAPPAHWLAKNYAYQQLAASASGDILVFCGVDLKLATDSLRLMVETMLSQSSLMTSFMPLNVLTKETTVFKALIQPNRYALELARPGTHRPPVLSTCWLIKSSAVNKYGGFWAVKNSVAPEAYFAEHCAANYRFYRQPRFGLTSHKSFSEQADTAVRTRYPGLHKQPVLVMIHSLIELLLVMGPPIIAVAALISSRYVTAAVSLIIFMLQGGLYSYIVRLTYGRFFISSLLLLPLAGLTDIFIMNYSMWRYEFSEVLWKGRNVCLPVMNQPLNG